MKSLDKNKELSDCCNAGVTINSGGEGTRYYVCDECHEPCDLKYWKSLDKKKIKYGEPCPECGLSWAHGSVKCSYPYPLEPKDYGSTGQNNHKSSLDKKKGIIMNADQSKPLVDEPVYKNFLKKKTKELEWEKQMEWILANRIAYIGNEIPTFFTTDKRSKSLYLGCPQDMIDELKDFIQSLLTQQRTELEQQKVKVVWNDVCEQIKQEARTELLEEIKTKINTWGGFEDDGGNLCHYDSEILEWVNDLLDKKDE